MRQTYYPAHEANLLPPQWCTLWWPIALQCHGQSTRPFPNCQGCPYWRAWCDDASLLRVELEEIHLENAQIPLVTQESQNGKHFQDQFWHLRSVSTLLWRLSYFIYSIHTHVLGLSQLQDLIKNCHFEVTLSQNGSMATMATTQMAAVASHHANNPPALVGRPLVLPTDLGEPPTDQQRRMWWHFAAQGVSG
jgi:hypothetical protein